MQAQGTKRKQPGEDPKSMKESDRMQASAANAAAAAAFGGGKAQKWGAWSTDGAKKGAGYVSLYPRKEGHPFNEATARLEQQRLWIWKAVLDWGYDMETMTTTVTADMMRWRQGAQVHAQFTMAQRAG